MEEYIPMTLDEAIEHALEKSQGDCACSKNHAQLAEWLQELKALRNLSRPQAEQTKGNRAGEA